MEVSIFPKPTVAPHLEKFVEARLHLDTKESEEAIAQAEEYKAYATRLVGSTGMPIYAIIRPEAPEELILKFEGGDISGGVDFAEFLQKAIRRLEG